MSMVYGDSKKKFAGSTTTATSSKGSSPQKKTFLGYLWSRFYGLIMNMYNKGRTMLWMSSTGFIILILPFMLTYVMEMDKEIAKISSGILNNLSKLTVLLYELVLLIITSYDNVILSVYKNDMHNIIIGVMSEQSLCCKCNKFYATAEKLFMCSLCYRSYEEEVEVHKQIEKVDVSCVPEVKQSDHSRCYSCKKKVGLLGYKCNQCDCSYCNLHRLPENHQCETNFVEDGKKEMSKNNPIVNAPKIEQI